MLLQSGEDAEVIVEEPKTEKFVQFSKEDGGIVFDLPTMALTPDEARKAKDLLPKMGIALRKTTGKDPKTLKEFPLESWQKACSEDAVDDAVSAAVGAMREVYGFGDDVQFKITRMWE